MTVEKILRVTTIISHRKPLMCTSVVATETLKGRQSDRDKRWRSSWNSSNSVSCPTSKPYSFSSNAKPHPSWSPGLWPDYRSQQLIRGHCEVSFMEWCTKTTPRIDHLIRSKSFWSVSHPPFTVKLRQITTKIILEILLSWMQNQQNVSIILL